MDSSNDRTAVPDGFEPMITSSPFNQHVGPYYFRRDDDHLVLGLRVAEHHCNSAGRLHGGMYGAMADIAIGHNIVLSTLPEAFAEDAPPPAGGSRLATVSMSTDFAGSARHGDWVEVHVDVQKAGRSLAFANAYVHAAGQRIGRVSAVFRL